MTPAQRRERAAAVAAAAAVHLASARAMLGAEDRMRRALTGATAAALAVGGGNATEVARALAVGVHRVIVTGRGAARIASHASLSNELAHARARAGAGDDIGGVLIELAAYRNDSARAIAAATAHAAALVAASATEPTVAAAVKKVAHRLDRIAATEAAHAFNAEREQETAAAAARGVAVSLMKRWDARLDRATCSVCTKLDGMMVPWGSPFPSNRTPGHVHPNCRCIETTIYLHQ